MSTTAETSTPTEYAEQLMALVTARVRTRAKEIGLSHRDLAEQIGMPYSTLQRRMSLNKWTVDELFDVTETLGLSVADVLAQCEDELAGRPVHVNPSAREIAQYVLDHDVSIREAGRALDYRPIGGLL